MADNLNDVLGLRQFPQTASLLQGMKAPKGRIGAAEMEPALAELSAAEQKVTGELGAAEVGIEKAKREEEARKLDVEAKREREKKAAMEALPEREALTKARKAAEELKFVPTKDNAQDLMNLFSVVSVVGMLVGKVNAQAAMASMDGMMKGYQQGRADLFKRESAEFDKNFKLMQNKVAQAQKDFEQAVDLAKYDARAGDAAAAAAAARAESPLIKAILEKQGPVAALTQIKQARQALEDRAKSINEMQDKAEARAWEQYKFAAQQAQARKLKELEIEAQRGREFKDVRGQQSALETSFGMPRSDVSKLGPKEVSAVSGDLESAVLTQDLANDIRKAPYAAGIVGSFLARVDRYIPSRYMNEDSSVGVQILNQQADKFENPNLSESQIAETRKILKKAVDVINARAMAASGGSRVLVSELNLQKGVIGLEGMSADSAATVYSDLAQRDVDKLKRFGVSTEYINDFKSKLSGGAAEGAAAKKPMPTGEKLKAYADAHFGGDQAKAQAHLKTQGYE